MLSEYEHNVPKCTYVFGADGMKSGTDGMKSGADEKLRHPPSSLYARRWIVKDFRRSLDGAGVYVILKRPNTALGFTTQIFVTYETQKMANQPIDNIMQGDEIKVVMREGKNAVVLSASNVPVCQELDKATEEASAAAEVRSVVDGVIMEVEAEVAKCASKRKRAADDEIVK
jgi:hypothetical protein